MARDPLARFDRLSDFVDSFAGCFARKDQARVGRHYVRGVLGDAPKKDMQGMWSRLSEGVDYQTFHHFITGSTWDSDRIWKQLRRKCPDKQGVLVIDDTGLPKQGKHSAGVHRQYSGTLGKIGNCQVIVSIVLRAEKRIWPLDMKLYLPKSWTEDPERREATGIPDDLFFLEKWRMALEMVDRALEDGIQTDCIAADAGYGDCGDFRQGIRDRGLHYSVGVSSDLRVFQKPPRFLQPRSPAVGRPATRKKLAPNCPRPKSVSEIVAKVPDEEWARVCWREGTKRDLEAEFLAFRVTPSTKWHDGRENERCWLLCERPIGSKEVRKYHLSSLPEKTALEDLVRITHERWAIEHNDKQLKGELGMNHFEGRSYPGLHRHLALTAVAYSFLERERRRSRAQEIPTLNVIRRAVTGILTMLYIANDPQARKIMLQLLEDPPSPT